MKTAARLIILGFLSCTFWGCGEEQTQPQRKPKVDPYADEEKCDISTFEAHCGVDSDGQPARIFCGYSVDAGYAFVQTEACDDACVVYKGLVQCVSECIYGKTPSLMSCGTSMEDAISIRQVVVEESCQLIDGTSYWVKETTDCDGVCHSAQCLHHGDGNCASKIKELDAVIGCNGQDIYVCDEHNRVHKRPCLNDSYCQSFTLDGEKIHFCAPKCTSEGRKSSVCSITDNYSIQTKCSNIGSDTLYQLHGKELSVESSNDKYCENGKLSSFPQTLSCWTYCQDYCYGNTIAPWWSTHKPELQFFDCKTGRCDIKKYDANNAYAECMRPCFVEGEEITVENKAYYGFRARSSTLECMQFDDGLYYSTVYVEDYSF